jgi:hypothetical protein
MQQKAEREEKQDRSMGGKERDRKSRAGWRHG